MNTFTIATHRIGHSWWRVTIHPTPDHLRDAAHRYRPEHGRAWWNECLACCQPAVPRSSFGGVLRFTQDHLTAEILAHETLHAAAATYRAIVNQTLNLGNECDEPEEQLAYIHGELAADLTAKLG